MILEASVVDIADVILRLVVKPASIKAVIENVLSPVLGQYFLLPQNM